MNNLHRELTLLRNDMESMFSFVSLQFDDLREYLMLFSRGLVDRISLREKNINNFDNTIYRKCEDILALYSPVAIDLRFVLSSLRIGMELERISDYIKGIVDVIESLPEYPDSELIKRFKTLECVEILSRMFSLVRTGWEKEDTSMVPDIMSMDREVNEIHRMSPGIAEKAILEKREIIQQCIALTSVSRKMERIGDHIKNICEEVVFFVEARILRHGGKVSG